jgi:hypothetical protein
MELSNEYRCTLHSEMKGVKGNDLGVLRVFQCCFIKYALYLSEKILRDGYLPILENHTMLVIG